MSSNTSKVSKAVKSVAKKDQGRSKSHERSQQQQQPQPQKSHNDKKETVHVSENRATRNKIEKLERELERIKKDGSESAAEIAEREEELKYQRSI
ncbi:hypothetical protein BGAL_0493g00010 [Botrytis galanthina]|uniref:Uncharacterized protein n=1 Tax=Botrytis galanthina TaxID=278940 RepID=A0A4S8QLD8_9HELO|nr:hypothetical protein BGAL_0493g00010 [Botrytis galanthina]